MLLLKRNIRSYKFAHCSYDLMSFVLKKDIQSAKSMCNNGVKIRINVHKER